MRRDPGFTAIYDLHPVRRQHPPQPPAQVRCLVAATFGRSAALLAAIRAQAVNLPTCGDDLVSSANSDIDRLPQRGE